MKNEIEIYLSGDCWMAHFKGPQEKSLIRSCGDSRFSTPYRASMPAGEVILRIANNNPGVKVSERKSA